MRLELPEKDLIFWLMLILSFIIVMIIAISQARSEEIDWFAFNDEQIADAIYLAEGGKKAKVPYGILSVKVKDEAEARRVCINTIRNNRKRFLNQTKYKDFIEFLGNRYAPLNAENDPKGLNKYWVRNVKFHLLKNQRR